MQSPNYAQAILLLVGIVYIHSVVTCMGRRKTAADVVMFVFLEALASIFTWPVAIIIVTVGSSCSAADDIKNIYIPAEHTAVLHTHITPYIYT